MQTLYLLTDSSRERTLVLATEELALSIKPRPRFASNAGSAGPSVAVALIPRGGTDDPVLDPSARRLGRTYGMLGLLQIGPDIFLAVIDGCSIVGSPNGRGDTDGLVSAITSVAFHCLNSPTYDEHSAISGSHEDTYSGIDMSLTGPSSGSQYLEHPCAGIRKILSNGQFYLSSGWDLSSRLEARLSRPDDPNRGPVYDERFLWNGFLVDSVLGFRDRLSTATERVAFDEARFVALVIQGYVGVHDLVVAGTRCTLSVISRLGWRRAGTRYLTRGVDDDGEVANFAETETILRTPETCMSYVQVRGSVPLFWEQKAQSPFAVKLEITRPQVASQPAFDKHVTALLEAYPRVHGLNLMGTKDHEAMLSSVYDRHVRVYQTSAKAEDKLQISQFDFHHAVKTAGIENLRDALRSESRVRAAIDAFGCCLASVGTDGKPSLISGQEGVFRVNCLDCLDRTNVIQDILSRLALESFVMSSNPIWLSHEQLWSAHRELFASNGDALSRIYAGTGALNTSFTRTGKQTFAGLVSNVTKSAARAYAAQVTDKTKQVAIDGLLGNMAGQQQVSIYDPVHEQLNGALAGRAAEYSSSSSVTLTIATWNIGGKAPGAESLLPWLFPDPSFEPDLLIIGFQELVELTANNVLLTTDPEKLRAWESYITQTVSRRPDGKAEYVLLRSSQLVGTALIVLANVSCLSHVRRVEAMQKKTGMKGVAGNKGAVAIRLDYDDSSFCFVTAHFAAGHAAVEERIRDYNTISDGLRFQRGKMISGHDAVVWLGDFNMRIALPNEVVRRAVQAGDVDALLAADEMFSSMGAGLVFAGYEEGPIAFNPTYKYDPMTDVYDTSEKQRVPAWTDRILYRGADLDLNRYSRAELRNSDHRPVMAQLRARVRTVDQARKEAISAELLASMTGTVVPSQPPTSRSASPVASRIQPNGIKPRSRAGSSAAALPPPSDDSQAWWHAGRVSTDEVSVDISDDVLSRPGAANPFERRKAPPPPAAKSAPSRQATTLPPRVSPPLPIRATTLPSPAASPPATAYAVRRKPPPQPNGTTSAAKMPPQIPPRPRLPERKPSTSSLVSTSSLGSAPSLIEAPSPPRISEVAAQGEDESAVPLRPSQLKARRGEGSWITQQQAPTSA